MPAGLPGDNAPGYLTGPAANPSAGSFVIHDLLSGPKGSPFDAKKIDYSTGTPLGWSGMPTNVPIKVAATYSAADGYAALSTGALSTGIGFGSPPVISGAVNPANNTLHSGDFTDDYTVGQDKTDSNGSPDSTYMYIGGGKSAMIAGTTGGPTGGNGWPANMTVSQPVPYTVGFGVGGAGNGASRDAGAGPAFTGFLIKTVTATGAVANGAAVETGWANRSGIALVSGQSVFGSGTAASAAPTEEEPIP